MAAAAVSDDPPAPLLGAKRTQQGSCPSCGADLDRQEADQAQERIRELEDQVNLLTAKATTAGTWAQRHRPGRLVNVEG